MDQATVVLFLILASVALIVLVIAFFGFWQSLKETNRKRRESPASEYKSAILPDITSGERRAAKIEFGEIIDEGDLSQESPLIVQNPSLGICAVCRKQLSNINHVVCPHCEANYHEHCFTEYERVCLNCGWRET